MSKKAPDSTKNNSERLAKRIASAGVCSRREAERLIEDSRVKVNGRTVKTPAFNVTADDAVTVNGKLLAGKSYPRLWLFHKPAGLVTTHKDPQGRPTVFDNLPKKLPRVISVGRLDLNSEGLLLLTNDGGLARKLELPSNGWIRRYRVRVYGRITDDMLSELKKGIVSDGIHYGAIDAKIDSTKGGNSWVTVSLKEGKNREIRKVFEHFDCKVNRLLRVAYGPFQLGRLPKGEVKEITSKVLKSFVTLD